MIGIIILWLVTLPFAIRLTCETDGKITAGSLLFCLIFAPLSLPVWICTRDWSWLDKLMNITLFKCKK